MHVDFGVSFQSLSRGQYFAPETDAIISEAEPRVGLRLAVDEGVLQAGHDPHVEEVKVARRKNATPELELDAGTTQVFGRLWRLLHLLPRDEVVVGVVAGASVQRLLAVVALLDRGKVLIDVPL